MKKALFICLVGMIIIGLIFASLVLSGVLILDRSGARGFENSALYWNGRHYVASSGVYSEGRTVAKTEDGWRINEVEEDGSHTFVVLRSFSDQYLLVDESYDIPRSGSVTSVTWGGKKSSDTELCDAISEITQGAVADFYYETEAVFVKNEVQCMKELYVGYGGCPISTEYKGYLGKISGVWYLTVEIPYNPDATSLNGQMLTVSCYTVPERYVGILEKQDVTE